MHQNLFGCGKPYHCIFMGKKPYHVYIYIYISLYLGEEEAISHATVYFDMEEAISLYFDREEAISHISLYFNSMCGVGKNDGFLKYT